MPDARAMDRRPTQPRRPFVGSQAAQNPEPVPASEDRAPLPPHIEVSQATEVAPAAPVFEAAMVESAAWSRILEAAPVELDWAAEPIENAALGDAREEVDETTEMTPEVLAIAEENPEPAFVEPTYSAAEKPPVVTAEVLAIASMEPDPLDAPLFVAPNSEPPADSLIDEVDAAFITAGLPTGDPAATNDALQAAASLEEIARRLRAGDIDLRPASGARMSSEESALATVLAALLANR